MGLPLAQFSGNANFGTGDMFCLDSAGDGVQQGLLSDTSLEWKSSKKPLKAGMQFPSAQAMSDQSFEGKSTVRVFSAKFLAKILGASATAGELAVVKETATIAATVSPAHMGTNFGRVLAVLNAAGQPMDAAASAPTAGQYAVNMAAGASKGQITMNAAEPAGTCTIISTWTDSSKGMTYSVSNRVIAAPTQFLLVLTESYLGKPFTFSVNVTIDSWAISAKGEDWTDVTFSWSSAPDSTGWVFSFSAQDK